MKTFTFSQKYFRLYGDMQIFKEKQIPDILVLLTTFLLTVIFYLVVAIAVS